MDASPANDGVRQYTPPGRSPLRKHGRRAAGIRVSLNSSSGKPRPRRTRLRPSTPPSDCLNPALNPTVNPVAALVQLNTTHPNQPVATQAFSFFRFLFLCCVQTTQPVIRSPVADPGYRIYRKPGDRHHAVGYDSPVPMTGCHDGTRNKRFLTAR